MSLTVRETIEIAFVIIGTILWFIGPVFARKTPQAASHFTGGNYAGYTAGDAWRLKRSDILQVSGATLIISSIIISKFDLIWILISGVFVWCGLWGVRTYHYYYYWVKYAYEDDFKALRKIPLLLRNVKIYILLYFITKKAMELSRRR